MKSKNKPLNVAYIIVAYPSLTKTFVDREIATLRKMGVNISIFSHHRPDGKLSPYQEEILNEIQYLVPAKIRKGLLGHLQFAFRHPRRYFTTLFYLLKSQHPTFKSHWRTLTHFHEGIYTASLLKQKPVEHIHAHFLNQSATIALVVSRMLDIPYSVSVHASKELFATPMMVREKLHGAKFIATCTDFNRIYLEEITKNDLKDKLKVIYHGLDTRFYRRSQPISSGKPVILSVGQLRARKGYPYLIRACGMIRDRGIDYECRIVGEGPEMDGLREQIRELKLEQHVILCGALSQDEVRDQYEKSNIFAIPAVVDKDGDRDGIPNVILEAMAMEIPVVSTWNSGIPEVVEHGYNGLLVTTEDPADLADALIQLIGDPERRAALGRNGRQTVLEKFDPERNAMTLLNAFEE